MINRLLLFRNVGQFDSVATAIPLARITVIYAQNGRGKTTLAAILRSLGNGDPLPIVERRRLAAQHSPHVVLDCVGGPPHAMFQNNRWSRTLPEVVVFDDIFINENIYSGLAVDSDHRQRLHELILGERGVALNRNLQHIVARIEEHNRTLRARADAIPAAVRGTFTVDDFCNLQPQQDIDTAIQVAERTLAAALEQDEIHSAPSFDALALPDIGVHDVAALLERDLPALDAAAVERVQRHLQRIGEGGEAWVADGMNRVPEAEQEGDPLVCPFCAQDLTGSQTIDHYRAYFSEAYADLKQAAARALETINGLHGGEAVAAFERAIRITAERRQFWSRFCELPDIALNTADIARAWGEAREAVVALLRAKQAAPLERMAVPQGVGDAIAAFGGYRDEIAALNQRLQQANKGIAIVKEQAAAGDRAALTADLARLKGVKARYTPGTAEACAAYLAEKTAKVASERHREEARAALDRYRQGIFPTYQAAINNYLQRFGAGFSLQDVTSVNTRAGSSCAYSVLINNQPQPISIAAANPAPGEPSFRNTLSAGDRNTLSLAFFFASLDQETALAEKIVVIDDPINSLDEHRGLTTVQEIRRLADRTAQVMILSHDKSFLCRIWEGTDDTQRAALEVARDGAGSTIRAWDVNEDCITEHDRRHALLRDYMVASTPNNREVAVAIRLVIEAFLRVAYPEHFLPGTRLGWFRHLCEQRCGTPQEILNAADTRELRNLLEYANRFHHDTNQAWAREHINDAELFGFVRRTLDFVKR